MEDDTVLTVDLLVKSNKVAFSESRLDLYPTSYEELKSFLTTHSLEDGEGGDVAVGLREQYLGGEGLNRISELQLDIEKKLFSEYAKYRVRAAPQDRFLKLLVEQREAGLLEGIVAVLQEQLAVYEQHVSDDSLTPPGKQAGHELEEIASYLISSMIQNGMEIQTQGQIGQTLDTKEICKRCIDQLLDNSSASGGTSLPSRSCTPVIKEHRPEELDEVYTAFEDLQLAHKFLTEKFESDRKHYLQEIEQLNRTNRELQQELSNYQSRLSQAREQISKLESMTPPTSVSTDSNTPPRDMFPKSPPSIGSNASASSPVSASFIMMKQEFKKLLNETQNKYERELREERELRKKLESQLAKKL
ncbi:AGR135Cp [Eremothecium gossypii ATCC 10895]|uniref:AGR135Cp n=1 Tax=Eremothecium gossypii (strain ATCC 10895 / CBS 109.51 / FGSC 9923 / NRRL Y-1056) TaxID=284811 RepID=Q74ZR3_EREGS|nr:AGR135Cp [Eremothecium gossypii ATCC 10895]AAS54625.2 AGR135Cp [Eremothecium gossypii ATCC 10895]AEY98955.1 FAGR135Cp [Eremothecium gossypii FDAG1]